MSLEINMTTPSDSPSVLLEFSNQLTDTVERSARSVVAVNARRKMSSTGVYWRSGVIVTADHTVNRDEELSVTLPDGRSMSATLAGRDSSSDLALLKLENVDLPSGAVSISVISAQRDAHRCDGCEILEPSVDLPRLTG